MRARRDRRRPARRRRSGRTGSRCERLRPLLRAIALFVVVWIAAHRRPPFLIPVAIWLAVRWCLLAPVVELEGAVRGRRAPAQRRARPRPLAASRLARRRSARRSRSSAGPLLGALLIFATSAPLALLNSSPGSSTRSRCRSSRSPRRTSTSTHAPAASSSRVDRREELPAEVELGSMSTGRCFDVASGSAGSVGGR